jgi:hypothetical protein
MRTAPLALALFALAACGDAFDAGPTARPGDVVDDAAADAGGPPAPIPDAGQETEAGTAVGLEAGRPGAFDASDEKLDAPPGDVDAALCVVVTPGYGCPPGFPYVRHVSPPECCDAP